MKASEAGTAVTRKLEEYLKISLGVCVMRLFLPSAAFSLYIFQYAVHFSKNGSMQDGKGRRSTFFKGFYSRLMQLNAIVNSSCILLVNLRKMQYNCDCHILDISGESGLHPQIPARC